MRTAVFLMTTLLVFYALMACGQQGEDRMEIEGEEIDYTADGVVMKGYLAYDVNQRGQRPGVLVVHEWWGHNDYARKRANMLAELGYTALAVDMYGEGKQADHPQDANKFMMEIFNNMPVAEERFNAAMTILKSHATVDSDKIAAIGYCFGGGIVLHMARTGADLDGVASFHGGLAPKTPAEPGGVEASILVCNGAADPFTTDEQIEAFKAEMDSAGADYKFINYEGALHSFTNPAADSVGKAFDMPVAYDAEADRQSWQAMKTFFDRIFATSE